MDSILLVLWMCLIVAEGSLTNWPDEHLSAHVGETVTLPCRTDLPLPVFWYFNEHEIFYGGKVSMQFKDMYKVDSSNVGDYNLTIPKASKANTGIYKCGDDEGEGEKRSTNLTVTENPAPNNDSSSTPSSTTFAIVVAVAASVAAICIIVLAVVLVWKYCKCRCIREVSCIEATKDTQEEMVQITTGESKLATDAAGRTQNNDSEESKSPADVCKDANVQGKVQNIETNVQKTKAEEMTKSKNYATKGKHMQKQRSDELAQDDDKLQNEATLKKEEHQRTKLLNEADSIESATNDVGLSVDPKETVKGPDGKLNAVQSTDGQEDKEEDDAVRETDRLLPDRSGVTCKQTSPESQNYDVEDEISKREPENSQSASKPEHLKSDSDDSPDCVSDSQTPAETSDVQNHQLEEANPIPTAKPGPPVKPKPKKKKVPTATLR